MNEVFKLRPSFPKYAETYDVRKVLDYLETIQTSMLTPLKAHGGGHHERRYTLSLVGNR